MKIHENCFSPQHIKQPNKIKCNILLHPQEKSQNSVRKFTSDV